MLGWVGGLNMVHKPLQHQVLEVVREWGILLLAWLCTGLYEWCMRQVEPSTHSLPGDPATGPRRSRAIIAKPLSVHEKHQRSPEDVET